MTKISTALGNHYKFGNLQYFFGNKNSNFEKIRQAYPSINFRKIHQTHSDLIVESTEEIVTADSHYTFNQNLGLCIFTADCIPLLIYCNQPKMIAAVHAGWRGVANQITIKTIQKMIDQGCQVKNLFVAIGPHIGFKSFEVEFLVKDQLLSTVKEVDTTRSNLADTSLSFFTELKNSKYLVNLESIIINQLEQCGLTRGQCHIQENDTKSNHDFHSYRRDKDLAGRQVSWISM